MIRFLGGVVLGAAGALYLLAVLLISSRETPTETTGYSIDWGRFYDSESWTGPVT